MVATAKASLGQRCYNYGRSFFVRTAVNAPNISAQRPLASMNVDATVLSMDTPSLRQRLSNQEGHIYSKTLGVLAKTGVAGLSGYAFGHIVNSSATENMLLFVNENLPTIAGIAAGVVTLGAVSLAASIRQNMFLGRENRKLGSVDNNNRERTFVINGVLLPMLSNETPQTLAASIITLTGGRLSEDNATVVGALSHSVLPGILTSEESGARLARLLFTNIAVENPLEFIQALYQKSEGKWALTNSNLAEWQGERSENLLAESLSIAQSCGEHDVKAFEKALALAEQAQDEQENPEIQGTITALRAKVAQLNSASNYTIEVPVDKWNAIFLGIWRSLSLSDEELASAVPTTDKYVLSVNLTDAQIGLLTQALQKYDDMTITPFPGSGAERTPEAPE